MRAHSLFGFGEAKSYVRELAGYAQCVAGRAADPESAISERDVKNLRRDVGRIERLVTEIHRAFAVRNTRTMRSETKILSPRPWITGLDSWPSRVITGQRNANVLSDSSPYGLLSFLDKNTVSCTRNSIRVYSEFVSREETTLISTIYDLRVVGNMWSRKYGAKYKYP